MFIKVHTEARSRFLKVKEFHGCKKFSFLKGDEDLHHLYNDYRMTARWTREVKSSRLLGTNEGFLSTTAECEPGAVLPGFLLFPLRCLSPGIWCIPCAENGLCRSKLLLQQGADTVSGMICLAQLTLQQSSCSQITRCFSITPGEQKKAQ